MEQYGSTFKEGDLTPKESEDRRTWRTNRRPHWDIIVKQLFNLADKDKDDMLNSEEYVIFNKTYHAKETALFGGGPCEMPEEACKAYAEMAMENYGTRKGFTWE